MIFYHKIIIMDVELLLQSYNWIRNFVGLIERDDVFFPFFFYKTNVFIFMILC